MGKDVQSEIEGSKRERENLFIVGFTRGAYFFASRHANARNETL